MTDFARCNLCGEPGTSDEAVERASIRCNVRQFRDELFTVWRCTGCGSLHCLESVDLSRYYADYPLRRQRLDFLTRTVYANYLRRLRSVGVRPGHAVLDFGCGKGNLVKYLRQRGFQNVSGFDAYSANFAEPARLTRTYDVVIAQDVIEHVDEPRQTLAELAQLVAPGGVLFVGTPDANRLHLEGDDFSIHPLHVPYHRHILTHKVLVDLADSAGCQPIKSWNRYYCDTMWPFVNYRYVREYLRRCGDDIDALFELPRAYKLLFPPSMLFHALFGYMYPPTSELTVAFERRTPDVARGG